MGRDGLVSGTAKAATVSVALAKLGFAAGQVVQELGWDEDTDDPLRFGIEDLTGTDLEDEQYADGADAVLIWFRDGDDDLVDTLVDALTYLVENGFLVLCTPRSGQPAHVEASDLEDAAVSAGLHTAGSAAVSPTWAATRMVAPKSQRR